MWTSIMRKIRIHPGAVARQLLANLRTIKPLTHDEQRRILRAIEASGVPNATDRVLASMSRNAIHAVLEQ